MSTAVSSSYIPRLYNIINEHYSIDLIAGYYFVLADSKIYANEAIVITIIIILIIWGIAETRKWAGWFEYCVQEVNAQLANKVGAHIRNGKLQLK